MAGDSPTFTFTPTVTPVFTAGGSSREDDRLDAARREANQTLDLPQNQPPTRQIFDQIRTRLQHERGLNNQQINRIFNELAAARPNDHITPEMTGVHEPANQSGPPPDPTHVSPTDAHVDPRDAAGLGAGTNGATAFVRHDSPTLDHLSRGVGTGGESPSAPIPPAVAYAHEQLTNLPQDPTLRAQFFSTLRTELQQVFQMPEAEVTQLFTQYASDHPELNITPEMIAATNVPANPLAYVPAAVIPPAVANPGEGTPVLEGGIKDFGGGTPHPGEDPQAALGNRAASLQYGKVLGGGTAAALFAKASPFEGRPTVRLADLRSGRVGGATGGRSTGSASRGGASSRARAGGDTEEDLFALVGRGVYQGLMG